MKLDEDGGPLGGSSPDRNAAILPAGKIDRFSSPAGIEKVSRDC
jgi:hypothetical protein